MRELKGKRDLVNAWRGLEKNVANLREMVALAIEEDDYSLKEEIRLELEKLNSRFEQLESRQLFGGDYDSRSAMLALHAGAGGTESQDWANMLLRMYLRWAESRGYRTEILDRTEGEEAGLKSDKERDPGLFAALADSLVGGDECESTSDEGEDHAHQER